MRTNDVSISLKRVTFFIFLLIWCLSSHLQASGQDYRQEKMSLKTDNMPLSEVLNVLGKEAKVQFFYDHSQINGRQKITVDIIDQPLENILKIILKNQPVIIEYLSNRIIALKIQPAPVASQVRKVSGKVTDKQTGEALPGASIIMKEAKGMGVVSDVDGKFTLEVPEQVSALVITFVGYKNTELLLEGNLTDIEIAMETDHITMKDVVVTGMAPRKTESFTGSYVSVKGEELKRLNPNNLLSALQIFDPSFRIVENNSKGSDPNAMPEFRMRGDVQLGEATVNNMSLLLGDYSNRPNMPLFILNGFEASLQQIVDLDPERVESITILKDAAATAIYGSRAANGVVVFETKQPKPGSLQLSYSTNIGISIPDLTDYNLMNAEEKLEFERQAGVFKENNASQMNYYNHYKQEILRGVNTYWLSEPLRTAILHRHTLSMEGGDKAMRYNLSINYNSQPGVIKESDRRSLGLNLNLQYRQKKWNIGNRLELTNTKGNNSPYGSFSQYTKLNPYYRKTDENGKYLDVIENKNLEVGTSSVAIKNPLYNTQFPNKDFTENFNVTDKFSLEYAILENLRVTAQASFSKVTARSEVFKSMHHTDFAQQQDLTKKGSYNKNNGDSFKWSANFSANYNLAIKRHLVSFFGRWDVEENKSNSVTLSATGFPSDKMDDFLFAYEMDKRVVGGESSSRSVGVIGQISYMYDYRYAFDFSVRGDISSKFGADTKMAPFWAAGFRWNMHKEHWFQNTAVSNFVIRGSYGITGSQNYEPYQSIEMYSFNNLMFPYPASDVLGAELKGIGNPDLGWSKTKNRSIAAEIGFLENRAALSFSYYNNYTDQQLLSYTLAPSVGFQTMTLNAGAVENKGFDIQLNFMPILDYNRRIQWNIVLNATHNTNVIKKISNVLKKMNEKNMQDRNAPLPIYEEGKSTTQYFTVPSLGIDPTTGKEIYLKRNGEKTFEWNGADKIAMGDTRPKLNGAITSSFTYKGFNVDLGFTYELGADRYNSTLVDKIENANLLYNTDKRALTERWTPQNRDAKYKAISLTGQNTPNSSRFLQKYNEFKFNSIGLGYRFESQYFKFMKTCKVRSLNLNFSMQDIARISTVKQERGLDYPFARSFNISLSALFN